jgi:uncharacterized protein YjbI with pentapeptide repeats
MVRAWPRELADLPYAAALTPGGLDGRAEYDTVHFDRADLDDTDASGARFLECAFTGMSVQGGRFRRSRFIDAWLEGARMVLSDFAETQWTDVTFINGTMAGVQAFGSRLDRVVFAGCKLDSVNFRDAVLMDVTFDGCLLRQVDFGGATLTRVTFTNTRLEKTDFSRVTLEDVDLRGAELDITITPDSLRGAIVTSAQLMAAAPLLAEALGIVVKDDD